MLRPSIRTNILLLFMSLKPRALIAQVCALDCAT